MSAILIDTCVWIDHLHKRDKTVETLLAEEKVASHSCIIGELAMGNLANRDLVIRSLQLLATVPDVPWREVIDFANQRKLHGIGLSWNDAQILAAAYLSGRKLFTHDKKLLKAARQLECAFPK